MGLAFIPLYIRYLGIEAYALIGLFALLQIWFSLLDMGLTPALGREMARFRGGTHSAKSIRDLLRSIEIITFSTAVLMGASIALSADWLAVHWLQAEELSTDVVSVSLIYMGVVTALRFPESIYRSSIIGLQRQVLFNVVNSTLATLRGLGAVIVVAFFSPTIQAFFIWQAFVSIITLVAFATVTYASLPRPGPAGRFSVEALRGIWKFAGGMVAITFLAVLLRQVDKLLLSKLLTLNEYGYYTLAAVVATGLYTFISPITQAVYPRLCEFHARTATTALIETFHKAAQLVSVLAGSVAIVITVFSEPLLRLWTQDPDLAERSATLLSLLMFGNLLNGLMWVPYQTQLAHGWTSLTTKINIVAVLLLVPATLWVTPRYGAEGAGWVWVSLNAGYVMIGVHFMYRRILCTEKWRWYINDLFLPLGAGSFAALGLRAAWPLPGGWVNELLLLLCAAIVTISASLLSASLIRKKALDILAQVWSRAVIVQ